MTYRSDRDALEARRECLEADLRALREKVSELQGVEAQIRETEGSIDELQRRMAAPEPVRRLPLIELDQLHVASPCTADWEKMQGDERSRFCGECNLHVFNLSAMTRAEAQAFVEERSGRVCVRFFRRHDGTVLTSDCPVGARKKRVRRAVIAVAGASAMAVASLAAAVVGLRLKRESCALRTPNVTLTSGGISPVPQPPNDTVPTVTGALPDPGASASVPNHPRYHTLGRMQVRPRPHVHHPR